VLTSNIGGDILAGQAEGEETSAVRGEVMELVRARFRPEFLNRIDEIILFSRLGRAHMDAVVAIQLRRLEKLLGSRKITLDLDDRAKAWLAKAGYDPVYGARPLKRVIQKSVQDPLAQTILKGDVRDGDTVTVSADDRGLMLNGVSIATDSDAAVRPNPTGGKTVH
jgi:ATP-dependent Clp protease ATP-binding subunit ClpB